MGGPRDPLAVKFDGVGGTMVTTLLVSVASSTVRDDNLNQPYVISRCVGLITDRADADCTCVRDVLLNESESVRRNSSAWVETDRLPLLHRACLQSQTQGAAPAELVQHGEVVAPDERKEEHYHRRATQIAFHVDGPTFKVMEGKTPKMKRPLSKIVRKRRSPPREKLPPRGKTADTPREP